MACILAEDAVSRRGFDHTQIDEPAGQVVSEGGRFRDRCIEVDQGRKSLPQPEYAVPPGSRS
jgi:hypothetical protein